MMDRQAICELIPHAGDMCLLEQVEDWSPDWIRCRTRCHHWPTNPLRREGQLEAINALEIAAQAVAVHGGLLASDDAGGGGGVKYLAAVRDLTLEDAPLDRIAGDLVVTATCLGTQGASGVYRLQVTASDREILAAQVTVMGQETADR